MNNLSEEGIRQFDDVTQGPKELISLFIKGSSQNFEQILDLIKQGVDVNYVDENYNSILMYAIRYISTKPFEKYGRKILDLLIEKGANINYNHNFVIDSENFLQKCATSSAFLTFNLNIIKYVTNLQGANYIWTTNTLGCIDTYNSMYWYLYLVINRYKDIFDHLIKLGANINIKNNSNVPLVETILSDNINHYYYLSILVDCGLNINAKLLSGRSLLCMVLRKNSLASFDYLMGLFIDIDNLDIKFMTECDNINDKDEFKEIIHEYRDILTTRKQLSDILTNANANANANANVNLKTQYNEIKFKDTSFHTKISAMLFKHKYQKHDINETIQSFIKEDYIDMFNVKTIEDFTKVIESDYYIG